MAWEAKVLFPSKILYHLFISLFFFLVFMLCKVKNNSDLVKQWIEQLCSIKQHIDTENLYSICSPTGTTININLDPVRGKKATFYKYGIKSLHDFAVFY